VTQLTGKINKYVLGETLHSSLFPTFTCNRYEIKQVTKDIIPFTTVPDTGGYERDVCKHIKYNDLHVFS